MREIHQLRDVKAWIDSGIKLSTPNNEAAKLYDAAISQFVGWYDEKQLDGFECTLTKMMEADPQFIGGRSLIYSLDVIAGSNVNNNPTLKQNMAQLVSDAETNSNCGQWEKRHVQALQSFAEGDADTAVRQWEENLLECPSDILSLHLAGLTCVINGKLERVGNISGRILPSFEDRFSLSTARAWHSFGLSETNLFSQAEQQARSALSSEPHNGWATHALAHVFEMTSRYDDGISYMKECESLWNFSNHIAGHNYWHWSLYYLTKGEFEAAIDVLDQKLINLPGFDGFTMAYLLSMEDCSITNIVQKYDEQFTDVFEPHLKSHSRSFIDVRVMMGLCACRKYDEAEQFMIESIGQDDLHGKDVNGNLLRSILAYSREKYEECIELLWPIRYRIKSIGGSEAQRDAFSLMLINACLRSDKLEHKRLAGQLIEEREIHRSKSPMIDRLRKLL